MCSVPKSEARPEERRELGETGQAGEATAVGCVHVGAALGHVLQGLKSEHLSWKIAKSYQAGRKWGRQATAVRLNGVCCPRAHGEKEQVRVDVRACVVCGCSWKEKRGVGCRVRGRERDGCACGVAAECGVPDGPKASTFWSNAKSAAREE